MKELRTARLLLEPLRVAHAEGMFVVLNDRALYEFLDEPPPASVEALRTRYAKLAAGASPDGAQLWLNWIVVLPGEGGIGFVQATVVGATAWVAYLLAKEHWSCGYATEAMSELLRHLSSAHRLSLFKATVEVSNLASIGVLRRLGFRAAQAHELSGSRLSATECLYVKNAAGPRA